jgi:hypothetical protein
VPGWFYTYVNPFTETDFFHRKFPSVLEGWHVVTGWFGMMLFQSMLPEVCNFGFSLFFFPLMKKEAKKSRLQRKNQPLA